MKNALRCDRCAEPMPATAAVNDKKIACPACGATQNVQPRRGAAYHGMVAAALGVAMMAGAFIGGGFVFFAGFGSLLIAVGVLVAVVGSYAARSDEGATGETGVPSLPLADTAGFQPRPASASRGTRPVARRTSDAAGR